ncbi:MAG: right-handed parallel beta-helix repeat-containing protein, partial [Proteobacteria bacterium]|nr:right-handed parallel beta-helix repeat-containing protein [Pseudomonadota bacterium]
MDIDLEIIRTMLQEAFASKPKVVDSNLKALMLGFDYAKQNFSCPLPVRAEVMGDNSGYILIDGNELHDLKLGSSEGLVLNGNVALFAVTNNLIYDCDNIGIDLIGFEGIAPDPDYDQARNGVVSNNTVHDISSFGNPAYGDEYSAGGIYADGARDITIEQNSVYRADIGIEIASEHQGRATSGLIVRNNYLFNNRLAGIAMGGYDTERGSTENCTIVNNTLYHNDSLRDGNGEILLQFDTRGNVIVNNILYANDQSLL